MRREPCNAQYYLSSSISLSPVALRDELGECIPHPLLQAGPERTPTYVKLTLPVRLRLTRRFDRFLWITGALPSDC